MTDIKLNSSEKGEYIVGDERKLNISTSPQTYELSTKYHASEIVLNETLIKSAIKMIWAGILLIFIGIVSAIFCDKSFDLLILVAGAFVDVFSGTMIHLVNKSSESKQNYFEKLTVVEHEQRIIGLIKETNSTNSFQCKMVSKIVDNHCNRNK